MRANERLEKSVRRSKALELGNVSNFQELPNVIGKPKLPKSARRCTRDWTVLHRTLWVNLALVRRRLAIRAAIPWHTGNIEGEGDEHREIANLAADLRFRLLGLSRPQLVRSLVLAGHNEAYPLKLGTAPRPEMRSVEETRSAPIPTDDFGFRVPGHRDSPSSRWRNGGDEDSGRESGALIGGLGYPSRPFFVTVTTTHTTTAISIVSDFLTPTKVLDHPVKSLSQDQADILSRHRFSFTMIPGPGYSLQRSPPRYLCDSRGLSAQLLRQASRITCTAPHSERNPKLPAPDTSAKATTKCATHRMTGYSSQEVVPCTAGAAARAGAPTSTRESASGSRNPLGFSFTFGHFSFHNSGAVSRRELESSWLFLSAEAPQLYPQRKPAADSNSNPPTQNPEARTGAQLQRPRRAFNSFNPGVAASSLQGYLLDWPFARATIRIFAIILSKRLARAVLIGPVPADMGPP
ncbi:hypothetical protein B0H16DRAFT_1797470 [Mycena metata]|uniref:Uncharacterized protein n=1 Tax=Mycena metata TaxID=1033252 RepID=A0AAD7HEZ8_9AGAR|nr:hypothetical protein B0H16DRAFT_1797470 [Mycena metata]